MKKLASDLKSINTQLKALLKKTDALAKELGKTVTKTKTKPKRTVKKKKSVRSASSATRSSRTILGKKSRISSSTEAALQIIKRHKRGIDVVTLKKKTGFDDKKISNIVHRAFKKGLIKRAGRGIYKIA